MKHGNTRWTRNQLLLVLVVRDGERLARCEVQGATRASGQGLQWQSYGQTPTTLDAEGVALCVHHLRRLAQCGGCAVLGVEGTTLTWNALADCMLCAGCRPDKEA